MRNIAVLIFAVVVSCKDKPSPTPTPVTGGGAASSSGSGAGGGNVPIANASSLTEFCAAASKLKTATMFSDHSAQLCNNGAPTALLTQLAGNYYSGSGAPNLIEVAPPVNDAAARTTSVFMATSLFVNDAAKQYALVTTLSDADLSKFAKGLIATATTIAVTPDMRNTPSTVAGLSVITNQWHIKAKITTPVKADASAEFTLENNYTKISDKTFSTTTHMIKPDATIVDIQQYNATLTVDNKGVAVVVMRIKANNSGQPSIVASVVRDLLSKGVIATQKIVVNGLQ